MKRAHHERTIKAQDERTVKQGLIVGEGEEHMITLEYTAQPDPFGDLPDVLEVKMTLSDNVTWSEATKEFHNFLRAAGYKIYYDLEETSE